MLMVNNHFARFRLPGNLLKTKKKCAPYFRGNTQFPIYVSLSLLSLLQLHNSEKSVNFWKISMIKKRTGEKMAPWGTPQERLCNLDIK
jgi:hypothetical protein